MVTVPSFDRVNWSSETERKPEIQSSTMGNYFEETRAMVEQPSRNMAINTALNEYCGIESTAYALAVIRPDGSIATFISDEVKTDPKYLFTPAFQNEFLVASGHAPLHQEIGDSIFKRECDAQMACVEVDYRTARYNAREFGGSSYRKRTPPRSHNAYDDDSSDSSMSPGSRKRLRATGTRSRDRAIPTLPTRTISIGDDAARDDRLPPVPQGYAAEWVQGPGQGMGQAPRAKEAVYVPIHEGLGIRSQITCTSASESSFSCTSSASSKTKIPRAHARVRGVAVAKLEEVTREAMATWFADREKPKNAEKRGFLTQLFRVLYKEERYRRGELDGSATVSVNDGAGTTDDDDDDEDSDPSPQHREAHTISPFLPTPSSSLSPSHPISSTASADMQDYYPPRLPHRTTYIPTTPDTTT
ncbi:hypothetical protein VE04_09678, partial [Pseudogymnoascus sp. 24MN13]